MTIHSNAEEQLKLLVEAWKTTVNTQQHFNSLQMQVRNFAVTLVTAILAATAVALKEHLAVQVPGLPLAGLVMVSAAGLATLTGYLYGNLVATLIATCAAPFAAIYWSHETAPFRLSLAALIVFAGLLAWLAFYFMDVLWYHRLLKGAVTHGLAVEARIRSLAIHGFELTTAIGNASPVQLGRRMLHSTDKAHLFYRFGAGVLVFIATALQLAQVYLAASG